MRSTTRAAVVQAGCRLGDHAANLAALGQHQDEAARSGTDLVVLPEAFLTGYVADSAEEARELGLPRDDERLLEVGEHAVDVGVATCVGFLERAGAELYNTVGLWDRDGRAYFYRKRHLPHLGADRFATPGDGPAPTVVRTTVGRVGFAICYELRFPEVIRALALAGAEMVLLPTAWPAAGRLLATHFTRVRAAENFVHVLAANRPDEECGVGFIGTSSITDPLGSRLAVAGATATTITSDLDLRLAHCKALADPAIDFEVRPWDDGRPSDYAILTSTAPTVPTVSNQE